MQALIFIVVSIVLWFVADYLLRVAERMAGRTFESRSLIFLFVLGGLAMVTFAAIRHFADL